MGLQDGRDIQAARDRAAAASATQDAQEDLRKISQWKPGAGTINQEGTSVTTPGSSLNVTTNDLAADVNLKKRRYGAGGNSRYTDAEIEFMVSGGGARLPDTFDQNRETSSSKKNRRNRSTPTPSVTTVTDPTTGRTVTVDPETGQEVSVDPETGEVVGGSLADVSRRAIEGQIQALEAQYGLDLASIAALGGEIGSQARFLLDQLNIDQGRAQEDLIGNLVSRGIFRSGITARDMGRQLQDFAGQRAEIEMNKGSRLRQLAERAGAASAALGRGKADVIANIDQGNLPAEIRSRLLGELQGLTPADIQAALNNAYQGNQQALSDVLESVGQGGLRFSGDQVNQAVSSYTGPSVVGGYNIDPATGMATTRVEGDTMITGDTPQPQVAGPIARQPVAIDPEELNKLLMSGQLAGFGNALQTAPRGVQG